MGNKHTALRDQGGIEEDEGTRAVSREYLNYLKGHAGRSGREDEAYPRTPGKQKGDCHSRNNTTKVSTLNSWMVGTEEAKPRGMRRWPDNPFYESHMQDIAFTWDEFAERSIDV